MSDKLHDARIRHANSLELMLRAQRIEATDRKALEQLEKRNESNPDQRTQ